MFFFFQAEDGIRDRNVTGVQTCALPISMGKTFCTARISSSVTAVRMFLHIVIILKDNTAAFAAVTLISLSIPNETILPHPYYPRYPNAIIRSYTDSALPAFSDTLPTHLWMQTAVVLCDDPMPQMEADRIPEPCTSKNSFFPGHPNTIHNKLQDRPTLQKHF